MSSHAPNLEHDPKVERPNLQLVQPSTEAVVETPKEAALAIAGTFRALRVKFEERDAAYTRLRRETLGSLLVKYGGLTEAQVTDSRFASTVRATEEEANSLRGGDRLDDLADKYEDHPFDQTMSALQRELGKSQFADQVITMRRAGMLILEQTPAE